MEYIEEIIEEEEEEEQATDATETIDDQVIKNEI